jgi:predicted RNase H-like HicB family nuclease
MPRRSRIQSGAGPIGHAVASPFAQLANGSSWATSIAGWAYNEVVHLSIDIDREEDGRWIAEALELPGVMTYGQTREEAISNTERLAIEVIADRIKHAELPPSALNVSFQVLSEQLAGD